MMSIMSRLLRLLQEHSEWFRLLYLQIAAMAGGDCWAAGLSGSCSCALGLLGCWPLMLLGTRWAPWVLGCRAGCLLLLGFWAARLLGCWAAVSCRVVWLLPARWLGGLCEACLGLCCCLARRVVQSTHIYFRLFGSSRLVHS